MTAPASTHQDVRAALLEVYQILRGAALRARDAGERLPTPSTASGHPPVETRR
jgi:hypothetical protein